MFLEHDLDLPSLASVSERLGLAAWDCLLDAVYWIRRDGSLVYVNSAACAMLGYSREELLAKRVYDFNPELSEQRWSALWTALAQQEHRRFRSFHQTRQGQTLSVEISASLVEVDGELFSCALARDVTAQLAAEESHRREHEFVTSLIDTAPVVITVLDPEARIVRFNRTAERLSEYSLDEVLDQSWLDLLVHSADRSLAERFVQRVISGATMPEVACRICTKGGALREIVWHHQLLTSPDTGELALLLIGQDVTDQRELEQNLRQSEKLQAIGRLAGGIAHDFNNQLTGIMGWAEVLSWEGQNQPTVRECAERIVVASERAKALTSQLLAYARKGPHVARSVDLHGLLHEVSAMLQRSIDKRICQTLELNAASARVEGDPTQLVNAILNVALNARDAMPDGGTLTFSTRLVPRHSVPNYEEQDHGQPLSEEFIELAVTDTGCGMSETTKQHLFEPFFTTKQEGRGTGLGLAATYGTIKGHRGAIAAESAPGRGTCIRIWLPHVFHETEAVVAAAPLATSQASVSLRVMLIDDEQTVREVTSRFLRHLECKVIAFDNGFDAIDYFNEAASELDVVLLDLIMPMLDGKSTFHALRRIDARVPIILVSGHSVEGTAQALLLEGAFDFVAKPFTLQTLSGVLARVRAQAPAQSLPLPSRGRAGA